MPPSLLRHKEFSNDLRRSGEVDRFNKLQSALSLGFVFARSYRLLAEPPFGSRAQLPQSHSGAPCPILVRGETGQVTADQSVHREVALGGEAANSSKDVFVRKVNA